MSDSEEIRREAERLLREAYRIMGAKGGAQNTENQRRERSKNLKRARWKRYHPLEPYPEDLENSG